MFRAFMTWCMWLMMFPALAAVQPMTTVKGYAFPTKAIPLLPVLADAARNSGYPPKGFEANLPAQVEQETCASLTHSKCFNSRAELKTDREYGFNLGQVTIAYNANGTERFNLWKELRKQYPKELAGWTWENRFDPTYGVLAIIMVDKSAYVKVSFAKTTQDRMEMTHAVYNGGMKDILVGRRLCLADGGDPTIWLNSATKKGLSNYSTKSRTVRPPYGMSFFDINRTYVTNIRYKRVPHYAGFMQVF